MQRALTRAPAARSLRLGALFAVAALSAAPLGPSAADPPRENDAGPPLAVPGVRLADGRWAWPRLGLVRPAATAGDEASRWRVGKVGRVARRGRALDVYAYTTRESGDTDGVVRRPTFRQADYVDPRTGEIVASEADAASTTPVDPREPSCPGR